MKRGADEDILGSGPGDDPFDDDSAAETDAQQPAESESSENKQLPYIHSRDHVKEDRTQRPIFLRDKYDRAIDELVIEMEDRFDRNVYKTDVQEALVALAQQHPDDLAAILDEWGYGWE